MKTFKKQQTVAFIFSLLTVVIILLINFIANFTNFLFGTGFKKKNTMKQKLVNV